MTAHKIILGGMMVSVRGCRGKSVVGAALVLLGTLLIFLCLPAQLILIALGLTLAAIGLMLLR